MAKSAESRHESPRLVAIGQATSRERYLIQHLKYILQILVLWLEFSAVSVTLPDPSLSPVTLGQAQYGVGSFLM